MQGGTGTPQLEGERTQELLSSFWGGRCGARLIVGIVKYSKRRRLNRGEVSGEMNNKQINITAYAPIEACKAEEKSVPHKT